MVNGTRKMLFPVVVLGVVSFFGCRQVVTIPVEFELSENVGTFDVQAGVPTSNVGQGSVGDLGVDIGTGTMRIKPENVSFTPASTPAKGLTNFQAGATLIVTASIATVDEAQTVCDTGEEYPPFTVTLDENNDVVSITPSTVTLTQNTLDILNTGQFSFCLVVDSTASGTVVINALSFNVGL